MWRQEVIVPLVIVGVMGPGEGATARDREDAYQLGRAIAQEGWSLVTGGRNEGVMDSASRAAKEAGGLTISNPVAPRSSRIPVAVTRSGAAGRLDGTIRIRSGRMRGGKSCSAVVSKNSA